ncbi:FdhF/YdeP family oxidoreductase [Rhodoblastus sp.]|uniref:FdhF/YdeP family oxidoreductase n=1 Tax=Rhodoblastus sp. TaxID=1962975 RepID=UPI003F99DF53
MARSSSERHLTGTEPPEPRSYDGVAGGWGSLKGISEVFAREMSSPAVLETLARQNKAGGHMCTSCAWGKPAHPHVFEFCENGAKATLWELTRDRCTPDFFADHTVSELMQWSDFDLEMQGRLTHPMVYNPDADKYVECAWDEAFEKIGERLKTLDPKSSVFYASGKASLETSYLYALFARFYGHNNLPDSSNMCHETTSVALKQAIGTPVGSCVMEDFDHCDAIFYFGQNPGTNSPRFLHNLQDAARRGCKIVVFNPVREIGLIRFINPQNPVEMLTGQATQLSHMYLQVRPGGDIAALMGLCKRVFQVDEERRSHGQSGVLDQGFIAHHTQGFDEFRQKAMDTDWAEIERCSGLSRGDLEAAGDVYISAERVIGVYGMGLTQHVHGSQNIGMLVNLLLLRGNIGRQGAGVSPVRGHSNVQGQRTVGITEKPELAPLDKLSEMFSFEPPREKGRSIVEVCEGVLDGSVRAIVSLGGNLLRAVPEREAIESAWRDLDLTVMISTKLNRSHLVHGRAAYILPCLARSESDEQASGPQSVSIEDSFSHIHGSIGRRAPASEHLRSELAIVAGMAKATLPERPSWRWDEWTGDYALVRELIAQTYPDKFHDFSQRMFQPGGFYRGNPAHEREWKTQSGKAEFTTPTVMMASDIEDAPGRFNLITMRSNDQFNTTIYGFSDRLRGIEGSRDIVLINPSDMARYGLAEGEKVRLVSDAGDGARRKVENLTVTPFDLPNGCIGGYYPEMNVLAPLWRHDKASKTPASKAVPVRIEKNGPSMTPA